ncbi:MAG TPA: adenylate/guanylate cyclase domain-containing protein [Spirochaetota bacterium]|mgnify:FL=1|nr:adenylate/guanylate cyclase domain-containing protein [Spirochaetota bacterium]
MKFKPQIFFRFLPLCLFILSISFVYSKFDYKNFSLSFSQELKYPFFATKDKEGNFYVIDNSKTRVIVFDKDKTVSSILNGGSRELNNFFYASWVHKGSDGFIYIINIVNSLNRYSVEKEEILRFYPDGRFNRVIFQKIYDQSDAPVRWGRLFNIHEINNEICVFYIYPDGIERLRIHKESGVVQKETILLGHLSGFPVKSIDFDANYGFVYLTKKGEIFRLSADGKSSLIYDGKWEPSGEKSVPGHVSFVKDGMIAFTDLEKRTLYKIDANNKLSKWISPKDLQNLSMEPLEDRIKNMKAFDDGSVIEIFGGSLIYKESNSYKVYDKDLKINNRDLAFRLLWLLSVIVACITFLIMLFQIYKYILNYSIPLILKQIGAYVPIVIAVMLFTSWYIQRDFSNRIKVELVNRLNTLLNLVPQKIDGDIVESIKDPHDYMSESYMKLRESLHAALNYNREDWSAPFYVLIHRRIGKWQYMMIDYDDSTQVYWPYEYNPEAGYVDDVMAGKIVTDFSEDQEGMWLFGNAPLRNSKGDIVALVEIGADLYNYKYYEKLFFFKIVKVMFISVMVITIVIIVLSFFMIAAIRKLRKGVHEIAAGSWDTRVVIRTRDEVQELGEGFNNMASSIRNYVNKISAINQIYFKFMPYQFMEYLNIKDITELKLGVHSQGFMTIMFSDIRSFTSHSESFTPKENFQFVNKFLSLTGPEIRLHNGFIDKYIGDAIMALFPDADDAVDAAIAMYRKTCLNPETKIMIGREPISIGIGIFTGPVMLGIVGEEERMSSTVISDSVNIASRIESLTKRYGTGILISKSTLNSLKNPEKYSYRFLGNIQVKGKDEPVGIFEILDSLDDEIKLKRMRTKEAFESAIKAYHKGNFSYAVDWFQEVLESDKTDQAAGMYLEMSKKAIEENITSGRMVVFDTKE